MLCKGFEIGTVERGEEYENVVHFVCCFCFPGIAPVRLFYVDDANITIFLIRCTLFVKIFHKKLFFLFLPFPAPLTRRRYSLPLFVFTARSGLKIAPCVLLFVLAALRSARLALFRLRGWLLLHRVQAPKERPRPDTPVVFAISAFLRIYLRPFSKRASAAEGCEDFCGHIKRVCRVLAAAGLPAPISSR